MTPAPSPAPSREPWRPWRSAGCAWAVTGLALLAGVPLFLRLGAWCDLTLFDVAAMNLLRGGVHYRDVFDTKPPGFVWVLTVIRAACGWSGEAIRAADLLVVAGSTALLYVLARRAGATRAARAWAVAGVAVFYPFTNEFAHCQPDVWMLLPAAVGTFLRVRRLSREAAPRLGFGPAALEGLIWGLGLWLKPHVLIPVVAVWLATAPRIAGLGGARALVTDFAGTLTGGLAVGAAGAGFMHATGTWPYFVEVFSFWNVGYARRMWEELFDRIGQQPHYYPPWSYLPAIAVPLALWYVVDAWRRSGSSFDSGRFARLVLAALYLGWTAQGLLVQRAFHYVHAPEVFLLLAVLATQRWPITFAVVTWIAVSSVAVALGVVDPDEPPNVPGPGQYLRVIEQHELTKRAWPERARKPGHNYPDYVRLWPECWRVGLSDVEYRQRTDALRRFPAFLALNDWEELGEVADWLRAHDMKDGELLCWHDAPHALYLSLRIRPGFRFQHVGQMMDVGPAQADRVEEELAAVVRAGRVRYVVSDLRWVADRFPGSIGDYTRPGPDLLPPGMGPDVRAEFPWNLPAVFRSRGGRGRYVIQGSNTSEARP